MFGRENLKYVAAALALGGVAGCEQVPRHGVCTADAPVGENASHIVEAAQASGMSFSLGVQEIGVETSNCTQADLEAAYRLAPAGEIFVRNQIANAYAAQFPEAVEAARARQERN